MKIGLHICILLLISCFFSCKAQKETQEKNTEQNSPFTLVEHDDYSGFSEYSTMVISDTKSLAKFYAEVNKTRKPGLPIPLIDFTKETVLVICAGEQKGTLSAELNVVKESDNDMVIGVSLKKNKNSDAATSTVISYPFYLYKIPLAGKEIVFEDH